MALHNNAYQWRKKMPVTITFVYKWTLYASTWAIGEKWVLQPPPCPPHASPACLHNEAATSSRNTSAWPLQLQVLILYTGSVVVFRTSSMSKCVQFCTTAREGLYVIAAAVVWFFVLVCLKELWLAARTQEAMTEMTEMLLMWLMCQSKQDQRLLRAPQRERSPKDDMTTRILEMLVGSSPSSLKRVDSPPEPRWNHSSRAAVNEQWSCNLISCSTRHHRPLWASSKSQPSRLYPCSCNSAKGAWVSTHLRISTCK